VNRICCAVRDIACNLECVCYRQRVVAKTVFGKLHVGPAKRIAYLASARVSVGLQYCSGVLAGRTDSRMCSARSGQRYVRVACD
jgi:hypothetical protein